MQSIATDLAIVGQIDVPVLLVFGEEDALFPPPAGSGQRRSTPGAATSRSRSCRGSAMR